MKKYVFIIFGCAMTLLLTLSGQKKDDQKLFVVIYTPGAGWDMSKQAQDQLYCSFHSKRLQGFRKEGKILLGVRYGNKGMIVMPGENEEEIKRIVFADSAVIGKTFNAEVFPYIDFYDGCVKK